MGESREPAADNNQGLRDIVARAIMEAEATELRKRIAALDLQAKRIAETLLEASKEGDRSAAIMVFSLLDDIMGDFYRTQFDRDIPGGLRTLLEGLGPLSTASTRYLLALALKWLRRESYDDAMYLRRIRNAFAHKTDVRDFEHGDIVNLIKNLGPREEAIYRGFPSKPPFVPPDHLTWRERYIVRAALTCGAVVEDLAILTTARSMGRDPRLFGMFDESPTANIQDVNLSVADVLLVAWPREGTR
jgi:hypothetical protein